MTWQRLHELLFYDFGERKVLGWRSILRRMISRRKTRFPRLQFTFAAISCAVPVCGLVYLLWAENNSSWVSELRSSAEMAWCHAAAEAYDRGERKMLELTTHSDFDSRFTGRKNDVFDVWTHADGKLLRVIPFIKGASEVSAEGFVVGWNRGMRGRAERTAENNLTLLVLAERAFRATHNVYTLSFADLGEKTPFSSTLSETHSVEGYAFALTGTLDCFAVNADPTVPGTTGELHYFADCSGRRFYSRLYPAGPGDLEILK